MAKRNIKRRSCKNEIGPEIKKTRWTWIEHLLGMDLDANPKMCPNLDPEGRVVQKLISWGADVVALCAPQHDKRE